MVLEEERRKRHFFGFWKKKEGRGVSLLGEFEN